MCYIISCYLEYNCQSYTVTSKCHPASLKEQHISTNYNQRTALIHFSMMTFKGSSIAEIKYVYIK